MLPGLVEIRSAAQLVHGVMPRTPQHNWPLLDERVGAQVWVKHENHAPTGAFKVRGGMVYFDRLARSGQRIDGVVTATRGNHGQSVGLAARRSRIPIAVVVPVGNSREKNEAMRALGVELIESGDDFQAAVEEADRIATTRGWHRLPSYHPWLIAGVATWALELFDAVPGIDTLYVPIGLGSGISGAIAVRDGLALPTKIVGVVSAHAPAYARSIAAGTLESHPVSTVLADGMACRTPVAEALEVIARGADRIVEVTDDEVAAAMRVLFTDTHNVAEGAGAAATAALLQESERQRGRRVAVVVSGGNVDADVYARVLTG
ncbi:MAG TPA: threonine dehydratase [Gemmatimonadaceae bacterium]